MDNTSVESDFRNNELHFCVSGEIDHHSASAVREQMDRDLFFYRPQKVVISLREVEFMDSSGLGLILGRYTKIKDLGGSLAIEDPGPDIEKLLELAGVKRLIPVVRSDGAKRPLNAKSKGNAPSAAPGGRRAKTQGMK